MSKVVPIGPHAAHEELLYPVNWWRARDGINLERYEIVFGKPWPGPIISVTQEYRE